MNAPPIRVLRAMQANLRLNIRRVSMVNKPVRSKQDRRPAALAVLLVAAVMVMSCGSIGNVSSAVGAASTAAGAISSQAPGVATPGATTAAPQSTARCQTIGDAYIDFQGQTPF